MGSGAFPMKDARLDSIRVGVLMLGTCHFGEHLKTACSMHVARVGVRAVAIGWC